MSTFGYNSTIEKKQKICVSCGKPCYWFSKKRCQSCTTIEETQKKMQKSSDRIIEQDDLKDLIKDADVIFSQFIRLKYCDESGNLQCYTCTLYGSWTTFDNGHYIKRGNLFLRFDERNCRPQCKSCNQFKDGNMAEYARRLDEEAPGITDILFEESVLIHKPTREELRQVIAEYTPKVKMLLNKLHE